MAKPSRLSEGLLCPPYDSAIRRILEVGCGIGLASLVLHHRSANISATDYHPEAERFMLDFSHTQSKPIDTSYLILPFKGQLLRYQR